MKTKLEREVQAWLDKVVDVVEGVDGVTCLTGIVDKSVMITNVKKVADLMGIICVTESVKGIKPKYNHDERYFHYKGVRFYECFNYPKEEQ